MTTESKGSDTFQLIFDGEDIQDGEMDVFALAPALLAVGELFKAADAAMNGSDTIVTTAVKSNFKEGSFEILLSVEQHLRDATAGLLPAIPLLGANNLVSTVIGTVVDKVKDAVKEKAVTGLFKLLGILAEKSLRPSGTMKAQKIQSLFLEMAIRYMLINGRRNSIKTRGRLRPQRRLHFRCNVPELRL